MSLKMTVETFRDSLAAAHPAAGLNPLLEAMWWEAKGDWNRAHEIAQEIETRDAAWVHAYLHRREGDEGNAGYWYRQAGRRPRPDSMDEEWREIVSDLLGR